MKLDFNKMLIQLARLDKAVSNLLEVVSRQAIINIKQGRTTQTKTASRIAKYLQCDIVDILKTE